MASIIILLSVLTLSTIFLVLKKLFWKDKISGLHGKHVLVTGGSSGIGKSVAMEAAKLGADVTIVARDVKRLELTVEEINKCKIGGKQKVNYISMDLCENSALIEEKVHDVEERIGPVFILVNCVGKAVCNSLDQASEYEFRDMLNINYFSVVNPTQIVGRLMRLRKDGHIVICGSQASLLGIYGMGAYCSSKFALRGYAETLYMEMIPYNVSVTLCLPPDTNTPGFEIENLTKPQITKLISQSAGLFEPDEVARQLLADAMKKRFFSTVGLEGFLLTTLCSGMSPYTSLSELFLQICLMNFFRVIGICYQLHFRKIILNYSASKCGKSE